MSDQELVKDEQAPDVELPAEETASEATSDAAAAEPVADSTAVESKQAPAEAGESAKKSAADSDESDEVSTIFNLQPRQQLAGKVKNITPFGAFIDLGLPQDGLVHISELSRRKVDKVEDVVNVGDEVEVWVKKVDRKRGRISLTMVKPVQRRIRDISEEDEYEGVVTRLESYGAFVDIDSERDGLVHISQITHGYINHPEEALEVGQKVNVKVLKVNRKKRQVDLSIKALLPPPVVEMPAAESSRGKPVEEKVEEYTPDDEPVPTAMALAFANLQSDEDQDKEQESQNVTRESRKQKQQQEDIIARTLAANK